MSRDFPVMSSAATNMSVELELLRKQLLRAVECGDMREATFLVGVSGVTPSWIDRLVMEAAIEQGHVKLVKLLVSAGVDTTEQDSFALRYAAQWGRMRILKYLLGLPGVTKTHKMLAFQQAAASGHMRVLRFLAPKTKNDGKALAEAASNGELKAVKFLVDLPIVGKRYDRGSALIEAARTGHFKVVKFLAALSGIDHRDNKLALHVAAEGGHFEVVTFLVDLGATGTNRALECATRSGCLQTVKFLATLSEVNAAAINQALKLSIEAGIHPEVTDFLLTLAK